jgi:hypothetical protein
MAQKKYKVYTVLETKDGKVNSMSDFKGKFINLLKGF